MLAKRDGRGLVEFRMPSLGADMEAGTLVEWLVKPGDKVKRGDIVAVVETQKGAIEIEVFETGEIEKSWSSGGTKVPVGTPLARIRTVGQAEAAGAAARALRVAVAPPPARAPQPSPAAPPPVAAGHPGGRVPASPAARDWRARSASILRRSRAAGPAAPSFVEDVLRSRAAKEGRKPRRRSISHAMREAIVGRHGAIETGNPALLSPAPDRRRRQSRNGLPGATPRARRRTPAVCRRWR